MKTNMGAPSSSLKCPHIDPLWMWAKKLIDKKPFKLAAVGLANNGSKRCC
jgi:hypothetical protein